MYIVRKVLYFIIKINIKIFYLNK
jgi:inorganic pyrophosphatase/exopolyphosphatase